MSIEIAENLIRKIGKLEGIRSISEAERFVLGHNLRPQEDLSTPDPEYPNIIKEFDWKNLSPEKQRLMIGIYDFTKRTTDNFRSVMRSLMDNYKQNRGSSAFTPEMAQRMKDKGYDLPGFVIKDGEAAEKSLSETELEGQPSINGGSSLVVFNLPPVIGRFWHRGAEDYWGNHTGSVNPGEVEWGYFYRASMPAVWEAVGYEENENGLNIDRLNPVGQHDPKNYYYVWEVSERA